ncbi:hypothetical protein C5167_022895 [Papaver somniferum]|uniref:Single-stranded DNA-binding protein n=1 Tax=Papaver somniferum TaxID=3469 RepID=A0A4Y7JJ85_PAPSO|nr:single-stranded DNA-binding protein, mitochondrial-like [Papaver somniferum]RZC61133.1 hypothetical protein C5167_022895 [Papaver somniferum]
MAILSRRISCSFLNTTKPSYFSKSFCTNHNLNDDFDLNTESFGSDRHSSSSDSFGSDRHSSSSSSSGNQYQQPIYQRPLENGLDMGVFKAILVGKVGQNPIQKRLKSGRPVTLFSLGTGGIRNNRRPLDNEEPREYADRCSVQWHRVAVYPERLGGLALNHVKPRATLYVEGNLETKVFSDPVTGLVRRIREIAIRRDGRLVFLCNDDDADKPERTDLKGVGYY